MRSVISKLKVIVKNNKTHQPISGANVYWKKIPKIGKHKSAYYKKFKNLEAGLNIDITNHAGFSLLWEKLGHDTKLWFYIHKVVCQGYEETIIENKLSVEVDSEKEFLVYLYTDNE